jgi:hypothetical protein
MIPNKRRKELDNYVASLPVTTWDGLRALAGYSKIEEVTVQLENLSSYRERRQGYEQWIRTRPDNDCKHHWYSLFDPIEFIGLPQTEEEVFYVLEKQLYAYIDEYTKLHNHFLGKQISFSNDYKRVFVDGDGQSPELTPRQANLAEWCVKYKAQSGTVFRFLFDVPEEIRGKNTRLVKLFQGNRKHFYRILFENLHYQEYRIRF